MRKNLGCKTASLEENFSSVEMKAWRRKGDGCDAESGVGGGGEGKEEDGLHNASRSNNDGDD